MNEDLIRRCDAMDAIRSQLRSGDPFESGFAERINAVPAVVEIVRCGDCDLRHSSEFCECRDPMAFCSDGVRRDPS